MLRRTIRFRGSSVVEQLAVNQFVVGSTPTRGAKNIKKAGFQLFCFVEELENCKDWNMKIIFLINSRNT